MDPLIEKAAQLLLLSLNTDVAKSTTQTKGSNKNAIDDKLGSGSKNNGEEGLRKI